MLRWRAYLLSCLSLCGLLLLALLPVAAEEQEEPGPKLVVIVVFDQMSADYLTRWEKLYDKDGLGRLMHEGAWFQNCEYPYAGTWTAAGHTSLSTGCPPRKHGIIANDWYDRAAADDISAVRTDRFKPIPLPANFDPLKPIFGAAPVLRRVPSVGDSLLRHKGKAKVVALSLKDRAALLLAALQAQVCAWFSTSTGGFVSSDYYTEKLPDWLTALNKERPADKWFGKDWVRLRPELDYEALSGPDDVPGEGTGFVQKRTFPHSMTGGLEKPGKMFYDAVTNSPYGNELLLHYARKAIDEEQLGKNDTPDLLCLSFSANDMVGHCYGPNSQEVFDITLHTDMIVKSLLQTLDAKVGRGKYVVVLSADHGVCPVPEVLLAKGDKTAGRLPLIATLARAEAFLRERFGKGPWIDAESACMLYLSRAAIQTQKVAPAEVEDALAKWLVTQPGVQAAYTRTQLTQAPPAGDALGTMVWKSFDPERSGDVYFVLRPNWLYELPLARLASYSTTHGSPHRYDRHVPLLVYGAGVQPGIRRELVSPLAVASIAAQALRVPPPLAAEEGVPKGLFKK